MTETSEGQQFVNSVIDRQNSIIEEGKNTVAAATEKAGESIKEIENAQQERINKILGTTSAKSESSE